jgi:hypothetical protein
MPVPPIYEPEVAADAVYFAAHERRRELWVGAPTVYTIVGEKIAPGAGDRYLAKTGVDGQQTQEPANSSRNGNLFDANVTKPRAHGRFDDRAHTSSGVLWLSQRRGFVLGALALAGAVALRRR